MVLGRFLIPFPLLEFSSRTPRGLLFLSLGCARISSDRLAPRMARRFVQGEFPITRLHVQVTAAKRGDDNFRIADQPDLTDARGARVYLVCGTSTKCSARATHCPRRWM